MPHLIDKETGLCIICQRLKLAAIKEANKYKKLDYEARKKTVEKLQKFVKDPAYKRVINNNYFETYQHKNNLYDFSNQDRDVVIVKNLPKKLALTDAVLRVNEPGTSYHGNLAKIPEDQETEFSRNDEILIKETNDGYIMRRRNTSKEMVLFDKRHNSGVVMAKRKNQKLTPKIVRYVKKTEQRETYKEVI